MPAKQADQSPQNLGRFTKNRFHLTMGNGLTLIVQASGSISCVCIFLPFLPEKMRPELTTDDKSYVCRDCIVTSTVTQKGNPLAESHSSLNPRDIHAQIRKYLRPRKATPDVYPPCQKLTRVRRS